MEMKDMGYILQVGASLLYVHVYIISSLEGERVRRTSDGSPAFSHFIF